MPDDGRPSVDELLIPGSGFGAGLASGLVGGVMLLGAGYWLMRAKEPTS